MPSKINPAIFSIVQKPLTSISMMDATSEMIVISIMTALFPVMISIMVAVDCSSPLNVSFSFSSAIIVIMELNVTAVKTTPTIIMTISFGTPPSAPSILPKNAARTIGISTDVNNIIFLMNSLKSFSNIAATLVIFILNKLLSGYFFKYFTQRRKIRPDINDTRIKQRFFQETLIFQVPSDRPDSTVFISQMYFIPFILVSQIFRRTGFFNDTFIQKSNFVTQSRCLIHIVRRQHDCRTFIFQFFQHLMN